MMRVLGERLRACEERLEDIGLKDVPARLAGLVLRLAESEGVVTGEGLKIPTRYTHHQLAAMVGTSRETITRAFAKLRQAGAVELRRRYIHIEDVPALERAAA